MKNYAAKIIVSKLNEFIVDEIIVAEILWAQENLQGEWVDCTPDEGDLVVGCGWLYHKETNTFSAPLTVK
jgi:hypothetical protein